MKYCLQIEECSARNFIRLFWFVYKNAKMLGPAIILDHIMRQSTSFDVGLSKLNPKATVSRQFSLGTELEHGFDFDSTGIRLQPERV